MIRKSISLIEVKEFTEILIPCVAEAVDKFAILMPKLMKENLYKRLSALKNDQELIENERNEVRRLSDKLGLTLV